MAVLQAKCASCHDSASSGNVTQILDLSHLLSSGLIVAGDSSQGRLVGSIKATTMPPSGLAQVTSQELITIQSFITSVRVVGAAPPVANTPIIPAGMMVGSDSALKTQALKAIQVNCAGCHQSNAEGGITQIMDTDHIVSTGLVTMGNPALGRLTGSILGKTMPAAGSRLTVSAADQQAIQAWISSMKLVPLDPAASLPLPALAPTYSSIAANILIPKCTGCHGAARADKGIRYDSLAATMRTVTAGNSGGSKLYSECRSGSMPDRPFANLSAVELAAIKGWIDGGAANN